MTFKIARSGRKPLGTAEEVIKQLSEIFPDTKFTLIQKESSTHAEIQKSFPLYLRLLQKLLLSRPIEYPQYQGSSDCGVEFRFVAEKRVTRIETTCYGLSESWDPYFEMLFAETDWQSER